MNYNPTYPLTLLLLLAVFAGCDSADDATDPENQLGSYEFTVSGDVSRTLTGPIAQFGAATDPSTGVSGFGLSFGNAGSEYVAITRQGSQPGAGTHPIATFDTSTGELGPDEFIATYYTGGQVFVSSGGTLTLSKSDNNRMEGTISFTATSLLPTQPGTVTVTGNFAAVGIAVVNP
ncbi:MAG: hypothetical protein R2834_15735 [Rhodothermales bacterium]